mgnify:CR=1 FL=1
MRSGYYGSLYVSNFNRFIKLYRVILQAPPEFRDNMQSLDDVYVRTTDGMAPVSQFVTLTKIYGAEVLNRFNMFTSITVQGMPNPGYSSAHIIAAIEEVRKEALPTVFGHESSGMTRYDA